MSLQASVNFNNPPIEEVSYSLQFRPLENLHIGYLGRLWELFSSDFPNIEQHPRLSHEIERFGITESPPALQIIEQALVPRIFLVSDSGNKLIQIQDDRFIFNWRKRAPDEKYPRFENLVAEYIALVGRFEEFLKANDISGPLEVDQVEITNVNYIDSTDLKLNDIFCDFKNVPDQELEQVVFRQTLRGDDSEPVGRLYSAIKTGLRRKANKRVHSIQFTGRVHPFQSAPGEEMDVARELRFIRDKINLAFKKITSDQMHNIWGLEN